MSDIIFYPKLNFFTYIIFSIIIFILLVFLFYVIKAIRKKTKPLFLQYLLLIIILLLIFQFSYYSLIYHTMRYEFKENFLLLSCGPYKDEVYYKDITNWEIRDLKFNPLASFRFPGFALRNVLYSDLGIVRMYSTSSLKNVLIIYTKDRKYGISPKDEEKFLLELENRINISKEVNKNEWNEN